MINFLHEYKEYLSRKTNVSYDLVNKHIQASMDQFNSSWSSKDYKKFTDTFTTAMAWTAINSNNESSFYKNGIDYIQLYQNVQYVDLMRMLSYSESLTNDNMKRLIEPFVNLLVDKYESCKDTIVLVDYGCGLAYWTIHIAEVLVSKNIPCELILIDIYRESFVDFIKFLCNTRNIPYKYLEVTHEQLIPEIPACDYVHIMAVLEHTSEPTKIIQSIVNNIRDHGLIFGTFYDDPFEDYQHISYNLREAREILENNQEYKITNLGPYWNPTTTLYQIFK